MSPKMPVLIANPTGTRAVPDMSSLRSQCDTSNPGAVKSTRVAAKARGGKAPESSLRGISRITAAAQESKTCVSSDLRRVKPLLRRDDPPGDRAFTSMPRRPQTFPSAKANTLSLLPLTQVIPGRSSGCCRPAGAVQIAHGDLREPFGEFTPRGRCTRRLLAGGAGRNRETGAGCNLGRPTGRTWRRERGDTRPRRRLGHRHNQQPRRAWPAQPQGWQPGRRYTGYALRWVIGSGRGARRRSAERSRRRSLRHRAGADGRHAGRRGGSRSRPARRRDREPPWLPAERHGRGGQRPRTFYQG